MTETNSKFTNLTDWLKIYLKRTNTDKSFSKRYPETMRTTLTKRNVLTNETYFNHWPLQKS